MLGLWIWNTKDITGSEIDKLTALVKDKGFSKLYMWFDRTLSDRHYIDIFRSLATLDYKVEVYALKGDPSQVRYENLESIYKFVDDVDTFNQFNIHGFDGVQMDIEPHILKDEWNNELTRPALLKGWVNSLTAFGAAAKRAKLKSSCALPFWVDQHFISDGRSVFEHVLAGLDEVVLMSYRDTSKGVWDISRTKFNLEPDAYEGKQILLAVETKNIDPPHTNFYDKGYEYMNAEIAKILRANLFSQFGGVVVHDYRYLKEMLGI